MKPSIIHYKTEINSILLSYADNLLEDKPAIIFIHAFPLNKMMWTDQMNRLQGKFRTVAYDIRGHGESSISDGQYDLDLYVEDLKALIDHLGLEHPILCGLSMGGYIALRALEKYPGQFRALILCDTQSASDTNEKKEKRFATIKKIKEGGIQEFIEDFLQSAVSMQTYTGHPGRVQRIRDMINGNSAVSICGTLIALASRPDMTDTLSRIGVPVLLLYGQEDRITPPETGSAMQEQIQGSKLYLIPGAGHLSNLESPGDFNRRLCYFLEKLNKTTPIYGNH